MKKSLFLIPVLAVLMAGCNGDVDCSEYCASMCSSSGEVPTSSVEPTSVDPTTSVDPASSSEESSISPTDPTSESTSTTSPSEEHVTILVLGQGGLYKGAPGSTYDVYENCILFKEAVGSDLPGGNDVTSASGATFTAWVGYDNKGTPTVYTKVPNENYRALYAQFSGGGGGSTSTTVPPTTDPTTTSTSPSPSGFTLYFQAKSWWNNDNATTYIYCWDAQGGFNADYPGVDMTFVKSYEDPMVGTVKIYSYFVESKYIGCKFARHVGTEYYNPTQDLSISERGTNNAVWCDGDGVGQIGWFTYNPAA